jgi:hypothetical protein
MIGKDELAEAARYADARAEELGLQEWAKQVGVDIDGLVYVANQRALRAAMIVDGQDPTNMPLDRMTTVRLSPAVRELLPFLTTVVIDGFALGFTAKHKED